MAEEKPKRPAFFPAAALPILAISGFLGYYIFTWNIKLQGEATQFSKFLFALRWQALSGTTLLFSIFRVGFARGRTGAIDPLSGDSDAKIAAYTRPLQNTLEQLLLNVVGQLALSTYLEPQNLRLIPALVLAFVVGRILFFIGYPNKRGAGFMLTFFPTIATYLANLYFLVTSGPLFRL